MSTNGTHALRQLPGNGVLARYGDLTLLCEVTPGQVERVGALLELLSEAAASRACGRTLSRRLAGMVSSAGQDGDFPAMCAFGPADDGVAALVHGGAELTVTVNGKDVLLAGRDAVTVIDRVITEPVESIKATLSELPAETDFCRWSRLDAGIVRADALVFHPDRAAAPPVDGDAPVPGLADTRVLGVYCKNAHFNDPKVAYCGVCGIAMAQSNRLPEWGVRPQLGVLVLDDGTIIPLLRDCVVGRMPEADEAVAAGDASPVSLADALVSRLHARVVIRDWQVEVIDAGSANGTFLLPPNESSWTRLAAAEATALMPGAVVAFGHRQARYYSYRNR